jgi:6-phosphogluconolactonase
MGDNRCDMANLKHATHNPLKAASAGVSRRKFLLGTAAVSLSVAGQGFGKPAPKLDSKRILVGSGTPDGILAFGWDAKTGTLTPDGIAAAVSHSTWLDISPDRRYVYVACELNEFQGKPTGAVASYGLANGKLTAISQVAAEGKGTCHLTTDHTGRVVICANYAGGTASSFLPKDGKLGAAVWNERYQGHGPVADRQAAAHAHFASLSPDNRFVYINDLGLDKIHIYKLDTATGKLTGAGAFQAKAGSGPRTLHFHPTIKVAYLVNELAWTVDVLAWSAGDGSLHTIQTVGLMPEHTSTVVSSACDAVLTRDGRFAYFANRGDDFLKSFHIDPATGKLTLMQRTSCGGKTPRNFRLDPTERWMLVANQDSSNIGVFARDPKTGLLANEGKSFAAATPMCIVFV